MTTHRQRHPLPIRAEQFDEREKTELTRIVTVFDGDYEQRIVEAKHAVYELERQLTRARHELARLTRHQTKLHDFRTTHQLSQQ